MCGYGSANKEIIMNIVLIVQPHFFEAQFILYGLLALIAGSGCTQVQCGTTEPALLYVNMAIFISYMLARLDKSSELLL